jgi:hypothetical protein
MRLFTDSNLATHDELLTENNQLTQMANARFAGLFYGGYSSIGFFL